MARSSEGSRRELGSALLEDDLSCRFLTELVLSVQFGEEGERGREREEGRRGTIRERDEKDMLDATRSNALWASQISSTSSFTLP